MASNALLDRGLRSITLVIARAFKFVREVGGQNKGLWVGIFQRFVGSDEGQSWCAAFLCFVLAIVCGGKESLPFPATGVCEDIHQWAIRNKRIVARADALPGDLFLYVTPEGHAHHCGFVTAPRATYGFAGNTSPDGTSDNGDGAHEHVLTGIDAKLVIVRVFAV